MNINIYSKMYCLSILLIFMINVYISPIAVLPLGLLLSLILFLIAVFIKQRIKIRLYWLWIAFYLYRIVELSTFIIIEGNSADISYNVARIIKEILCYLLCFIAIDSEIFNFEFFIKWYKRISIVILTVGNLQVVLYYVFNIRFYPIVFNYIADDSYLILRDFNTYFFRPTSFFYEPAHYFMFVSVFLTLILFSNQFKVFNNIWRLYALVSCMFIMSGQGYVIIIILFLIWIVKEIYKKGKVSILNIILLVITFVGIPYMYLNFQAFNQAVNRIIQNNLVGGNAVEGRVQGFSEWLNFNAINKIFGAGYMRQAEDFYSSSMSFALYTGGIIAALLYIVIFFSLWKKTKRFEYKMVIFTIFMLSFSTTALMSTSGLFMLSIIYGNLKYEKSHLNDINQIGTAI